MASALTEVPEIFPESFFNISQPDVPIVQIQVRTGINKSGRIDKPEDWTEVHFEPGSTNYFNTMTIEDAGGMQRVVITFFDKNFANVENAIVRSLVATKAANDMAVQDTIPDDTGYFEFKIDNQVTTNIRIRFGYAEVKGSQDFIDDTSFDGSEYSERTEGNKTVIRSPWIYLQMIGTKFNLRDEGLFAEITAFSVMDSFLNKAKLLRRFAVLSGKPKDILTSLGNIIHKSTGDSYFFSIDPQEPTTEAAEGEQGFIQINLGSEVNEKNRNSWRSMHSILTEVMSKIPPRNYDSNDDFIDDDELVSAEEVSKSIPYIYTVRQIPSSLGRLKTILEFKYPDPIKDSQTNMRTYIWKEYGQSIVKNLNIESQVDFASLNAVVYTADQAGDVASLFLARPDGSVNVNDIPTSNPNLEIDTGMGNTVDKTNALIDENYSYAFVSNTIGYDGAGQSTGAIVAGNVIRNLNNGVFKGTIEIPGDPFYLFDNKLSPWQYMIKIIVQRPGYKDNDDKYQGTSVSYLSGYYAISKISHTINATGFNTVLEVSRWPIEG